MNRSREYLIAVAIGFVLTVLFSYQLLWYAHKYSIPWSGLADFAHYHDMTLRPLDFDATRYPFNFRMLTPLIASLLLKVHAIYDNVTWFDSQSVYKGVQYDKSVFFALLLTNYLAVAGTGRAALRACRDPRGPPPFALWPAVDRRAAAHLQHARHHDLAHRRGLVVVPASGDLSADAAGGPHPLSGAAADRALHLPARASRADRLPCSPPASSSAWRGAGGIPARPPAVFSGLWRGVCVLAASLYAVLALFIQPPRISGLETNGRRGFLLNRMKPRKILAGISSLSSLRQSVLNLNMTAAWLGLEWYLRASADRARPRRWNEVTLGIAASFPVPSRDRHPDRRRKQCRALLGAADAHRRAARGRSPPPAPHGRGRGAGHRRLAPRHVPHQRFRTPASRKRRRRG